MYGINRAIKGAFDQVTLSDLIHGALPFPLLDKARLTNSAEALQ